VLAPISAVAEHAIVTVGYQGSDFGFGSVPSPALPNDLIIPWDVFEHQSATGSPRGGRRMRHVPYLRGGRPQSFSGEWTWEGDVIKSAGANQDTSWRLRYEAVIPEVSPLPAGTTPAQAQIEYSGITVPIRMGAEAIAQRIAYFYEDARGGEADAMQRRDASAEAEVDKLIEANARATQRQAVRRRRFFHGRGIENGMLGQIT
jgi:hypothetical protein